ncbi:MAG: DUF748 domain-containing protein [Deltaproteobacteria bacterium]|nr:DUF748 domain-containing protein [Deltaproteobacteria bacterium]
MTKNDNSTADSGLRRLWKRRSVKVVTGLVVFIAAAAISLPIGARLYLQKWLLDNGADSAIVEKVRFNPFTGTATLQGVDIEKDGQTVFSDSTIYLNVGLKNLFSREASLERATITNLDVDIEQYEDGTLRIASYSIAPGQDDPVDSPAEIAEELEKEVPWIFAADQIDIKNVTVRYKQPDLTVELVIEDALIDRFSTDPGEPAGILTLKGTLNGAPVALDLTAFNLVPKMEVKGTVDFKDVHLDDLAGLMAEYLHPFSGTAGLSGDIVFSMTDSESMSVHYDGDIDLEEGDIAGEGWATKAGAGWQGKISFSMNPDEMVVDVDGDLRATKASFDMPDPIIEIDNSDISIVGKTTVTIGEEVVVDTGASLKLAPTGFSMDILKTATGDTSWDGTVRVETGTDSKGLSVRADGKLQVADPAYSMDVNGALMKVGNQLLSYDGKVEYIMGVGSGSADFVRTDGVLLGDTTTFSLPEIIAVSQSKLNLTGKTEVAIGHDLVVTYQGDTLFDETAVKMTGFEIGEKQLTWSGLVKYQLGGQSQQVTLGGGLKSKGVQVAVKEGDLQIKQNSLQSKVDFSLLLKDSPSFKGKFSLGAEGLEIKKKNAPLLTLAGISMAGVKDDGSGGVKIGSLLFKKLNIHSSSDIPVSVTIPSIDVTDIVSPDLKSVGVGRVTVEKPNIVDDEKKMLLAQMDAVTADTIQVNSDISTTVKKVSVANGIFLKDKDKDPMVTLGKLNAGKISYSTEQGVSLASIDIDSVFAHVKRQKTAEPAAGQEKEEVGSSGRTEKSSGLPVKINEINVAGASGFKFTDETLSKLFTTTLKIKSLQVHDIDLTDPQHPFSYSLQGKFDKYAPLKIEGSAAPLAENLSIDQQTTLQNYSMITISPYAIDAIGTFFPRGSLDLTSSLKIADGEIDMKNEVVLKDLEVETIKGELADKLNNQLPVPLDLALTMLRDRDGDIELKIPLSGDLDSMSVGVADIVITALSKGITVAVAPYLAYTFLGPAGALAFVGAEVGASLLHSDLPSLEFEPGVIDISGEQSEILDKVGKAIEKDNKTSYSICAKVGVDEAGGNSSSGKDKGGPKVQSEATRKALFELGDGRSQAVKKYLLSHFKIDEDRLLIRNPGIVFKKGDKPVVEFRK